MIESIKEQSNQWEDTWRGLSFTDTTSKSLCDYVPEINQFEDCENQNYLSVNVGCDPRVHHLALKIIEANPSYLNDTHLEAVKVAIEIAYYNNNGKFPNDSNGFQTLVTGKKNSGALIEETYKFAFSDQSQCENECPIRMAWSSWTCHCGSGANTDNLPNCCNSPRKRFRGCRQPKEGFPLTCDKMSKMFARSTQVTSPTCNKNTWSMPWFDTKCSG